MLEGVPAKVCFVSVVKFFAGLRWLNWNLIFIIIGSKYVAVMLYINTWCGMEKCTGYEYKGNSLWTMPEVWKICVAIWCCIFWAGWGVNVKLRSVLKTFCNETFLGLLQLGYYWLVLHQIDEAQMKMIILVLRSYSWGITELSLFVWGFWERSIKHQQLPYSLQNNIWNSCCWCEQVVSGLDASEEFWKLSWYGEPICLPPLCKYKSTLTEQAKWATRTNNPNEFKSPQTQRSIFCGILDRPKPFEIRKCDSGTICVLYASNNISCHTRCFSQEWFFHFVSNE